MKIGDSRINEAEERISGDRLVAIRAMEKNTKKKKKKKINGLFKRLLRKWQAYQQLCYSGTRRRREREKAWENILG